MNGRDVGEAAEQNKEQDSSTLLKQTKHIKKELIQLQLMETLVSYSLLFSSVLRPSPKALLPYLARFFQYFPTHYLQQSYGAPATQQKGHLQV